LHHQLGSQLPKPDLIAFSREIQAIHAAIQDNLVLSAHDISEGGVAVALAEMSFKRQIGVRVEIPGELVVEQRLFSETGGFILEVLRDKMKVLRKLFAEHEVPMMAIGETTVVPRLQMNAVIDLPISDAKMAWENGLREKLL
jgi:phosphoribosylformylglycinamidine synthase